MFTHIVHQQGAWLHVSLCVGTVDSDFDLHVSPSRLSYKVEPEVTLFQSEAPRSLNFWALLV